MVTAVGRRIVIVDDDRAIAEAVSARLTADGFDVEVTHSGEDALAAARRQTPALVVLDLGLPGIDGIEVCATLRREFDVPVVMLTARDSETDVLVGLGVGADDYVVKPFSPRELSARVSTVLRRTRSRDSGDANRTTLNACGLTIDTARRLVDIDGTAVHLTVTEFDLLIDLVRADGAVRSRDQLLASVWGYRDAGVVRTVDSHIRSLRRKIGDDVIRTVHGIGYAITPTARAVAGSHTGMRV
jgi:DNA-binding response OmpR family regulator